MAKDMPQGVNRGWSKPNYLVVNAKTHYFVQHGVNMTSLCWMFRDLPVHGVRFDDEAVYRSDSCGKCVERLKEIRHEK